MTGLHLSRHHPQRRASDRRPRYLPTKGRWSEPDPVNLLPGVILIGLGLVLGVGAFLPSTSFDAGAALPFFCASALVLLGGFWLLFTLGQKLASRLRGVKKHCGCCRFYEVQSGLYVIGRCQANPSRHTVSRADVCRSFSLSERAMVRDRLAQHPRVLQQLEIIHTSENANQP